MSRILQILLVLAATILQAIHTDARAASPNSVTASFNVLYNGFHIAEMTERFETGENRYRIVSDTAAAGLFGLVQRHPARFVSSGRVTDSGLQPERFEGSRGPDDPRRVSAEFDWKGGTVQLQHGGQNETAKLPAGAQDRLSIMYQFMFLAHDKLRKLDFHMTNGRKLDRYSYAVTPDAEIDTPLGRMTTLHLVKQREPGDSGTEIWLAPHFRYLPVRMLVIEEDGGRYEQVVTQLEIRR